MIFATKLEAEPFIKTLRMVRLDGSPFFIHEGNDFVLAVSGIGKANAAIATTYCNIHYPSQWIVNLGCAGALNPLLKKGDIFQISKVLEPDRPHLRTGTPYAQIPSLLPGFTNAILATQDKPVIRSHDRITLSHFADLADMEGAAVIQAAGRFGINSLLFKFVSDTVQDSDEDEIIPFVREHGKYFSRFFVEQILVLLEQTTIHITNC